MTRGWRVIRDSSRDFWLNPARSIAPDDWNEVDRESLATATALKALEHRYSSLVIGGPIGHKKASRYKGILPTNLGEGHFSLSCGCHAWKI